jgi:hypothetical protein
MTTIRRVMRARSTRPLHCGHVPTIGQKIIRVEGSGWCCLDCTLRLARGATAASPADRLTARTPAASTAQDQENGG